ncbi:sensor histidine kinase [Enterococcus sp. AZ103]|uniref:sensor histidine kinase n=1 Tax=Enterococcus sp. AZ103 TaxID=2774628 RepID=UPI003F1E85D4
MNNTLLKKQRIRYFLMNMLAFALIFLTLGIVMIRLVTTNIYKETDQSLINMSEKDDLIQQEIDRLSGKDNKLTQTPPPDPTGENLFNSQIILWSKDGTILNNDENNGRLAQLTQLKLNKSNLNTVNSLEVSSESGSGSFSFHSITKKYTNSDNNQIAYVEFLVNTNQVTQTVKTFQTGLIIAMFISWIISLFISYYLSALMMRPIMKAWRKQQDFVENASHELRTPLTIIQNKLQSVFQHPDQTILDEAESIALALNETRRLSILTNDLLTLARGETNTYSLNLIEVDSQEFLNQLVTPFREIAEKEQKTLILTNTLSQLVMIDKEKVHQLFVILLDNALKYTTSGDTISVTSKRSGNDWLLEIANTGPSIDKMTQQKLFDRFYREDTSRSKQTGGYGLGLAIAQQIVHLHHGKIKTLDLQPQGIIFQIKIPLAKQKALV